MFWLLFGAFMYLMIKNQFDLQGVKKDVRKIARAVKKALMGAGKSIQAAAQEAQKQKAAKARMGQTPWRKKREPEKIRTKPFTGARMNREMRKVRDTAVTPA